MAGEIEDRTNTRNHTNSMNETTQLIQRPQHSISETLSVTDLLQHVELVQNVMKTLMKEGLDKDYGTIPGTPKPTLLQPGAQKLLLAFRMNPDYDVTVVDLDRAHREYRVSCKLTTSSGQFVGAGVGSASTMESKWRFRTGPKEFTDKPVPADYWNNRKTDPAKSQESIGGKGFTVGKNESGQWMIAVAGEKVEHDNPADYYNTCLKMGKKRALVDAVLTRTAASDIFTQDLEEIRENLDAATGAVASETQKPRTAPEPRQAVAKPQANGETKGIATLLEVREASGNSARGPWTAWFCTFQDASGQSLEAGTFDKKIAEGLEVLKGQEVNFSIRPGKKAGKFELTSIEPADDVPMGVTP